MKSLTIVYITARENPRFEWFLKGLDRRSWQPRQVIVVQAKPIEEKFLLHFFERCVYPASKSERNQAFIRATLPKPTVWQGGHRLTKQDWWAVANARNTGIALCQTEWIAFIDDRSVLVPGWLDCVREAMEGNYAVFGAYEKRVNMRVVNGQIIEPGQVVGVDDRETYTNKHWGGMAPVACGGEWSYGANIALPLEWALEANGFSEVCDGSGAEDVYFGRMVQANDHPCKYDKRMKVIQDRTPSEVGTPMRREDFGVSPNDYSHMLLNMHMSLKRAPHPFDIRDVRDAALRSEPWPKPWGPRVHLWTQQPLGEL